MFLSKISRLQSLVGKGNIQSLMSNIIFAMFGFVSFVVMVRLLNPDVFGHWVLFITVCSLVDMFRLGLTGTAAIRFLSVAAGTDEKKCVTAASYQLSFVSSLAIVLLLFLLYVVSNKWFPNNAYTLIFLYYPLFAIANLPFNQALVVAQGNNDFRKVLIIRSLAGFFSFAALVSCLLFVSSSIDALILAYVVAYFLVSVVVVACRWDGLRFITTSCKTERREILQFGKYSTAGYIGSNLLRSSDTILLSFFSFMGTEAISVLAVPFKFVEIVEIPLRSFSATALPRLTKAYNEGFVSFNRVMFNYTLGTTLLLIPFVIILVLFPEFFLHLLGGSNIDATLLIQKQILYVICLYILVLPIDRYSGVALFAMNKPAQNFYKIMFMLCTNVFFDLIAIMYFKSLLGVAIATLIFTVLGVALGWIFFVREQKSGFFKTLHLIFVQQSKHYILNAKDLANIRR